MGDDVAKCICLFNILRPPSVSGRRHLSRPSRPKVKVRGCAVSRRKPRPCGDLCELRASAGKITQEAETSRSAFMCGSHSLFIYLFGCFFVVVEFFFLLRLLLSCVWSIFHYLISASQNVKKKKVCEALHKRGCLNTQLCSAQLRWHWTPAALFKSGPADSRANRTWQLIMWKWMRWRQRNSSAIEG